MDPFMLQQIMQAAQSNPDMFAKMFAGMGMDPPAAPPPQGGVTMDQGAGTVPMAPSMQPMPPPTQAPVLPPNLGQAGMLADQGAGAPMLGGGSMPVGPVGPPGQQNLGQLMQMMQIAGKASPQSVDAKPIMSGGIHNSQKAPEMSKVAGGASATSYDTILKLLMGGQQNPLRVPQLGMLMGGK